MSKHMQNSDDNTKIILESNQQLTKTLAEIYSDKSKNFLDPNTSHLRQKLSEDLQRENCVLTVSGCLETEEGKPGWLSLMTKLKFRNGYDANSFGSGVLKTIVLPRETKFTTVTFK